MSLSPWRSQPKLVDPPEQQVQVPSWAKLNNLDDEISSSDSSEKKGIWNWKPIRALSHNVMQKISCLFPVEVVTTQGAPASMNGLRLWVCVQKKETKEQSRQCPRGSHKEWPTLGKHCLSSVTFTAALGAGSSSSLSPVHSRYNYLRWMQRNLISGEVQWTYLS